jgi:hypothetical protein
VLSKARRGALEVPQQALRADDERVGAVLKSIRFRPA